MEDQQTLDHFQAHSEYVRKLNQQIVQKDNIIKLLQLQIQNLEEQGERGGAEVTARLDGEVRRKDEELARLRRTLDSTQRSLDELRRSEADAAKARATTAEEAADKGRQIEDLRRELSAREDEIIDYIGQIERLRSEAPAGATAEVARLRGELAAAHAGATGAAEARGELERARARVEFLEREMGRLESLVRGGGASGPDPLDEPEETAALRVALERVEGENAALRERIAGLEEKLARARSAARESMGGDTFAMVQEVIEASQRLEDLRRALGDDGRGEDHWGPLADALTQVHGALGIERIPAVGRRYDPELHQAVEICFSHEYDHDTVIREVSQGYMTAASVIKPADVVVCRNPYYCPSCKKVAVEGSRFCHVCGAKVLGNQAQDVKAMGAEDSCASFLELALCQEQAQAYGEARKSYARAVALAPENRKALLGLARVDEALGSYQEALAGYERLSRLPGCPPEVERHRRRVLTKLEILDKLQRLL